MSARIVIQGNVVDQPTTRRFPTGRVVTNFRIASSERRKDAETGQWFDASVFFVNVACWGNLGENVGESLKKGQPVVVQGRISQRTVSDEHQQSRTYYEVTGDTVSHDLTRGTSAFAKIVRSAGVSVETDEDGMPPMELPEVEYDAVERHPETGADTRDAGAGDREQELVGASG